MFEINDKIVKSRGNSNAGESGGRRFPPKHYQKEQGLCKALCAMC